MLSYAYTVYDVKSLTYSPPFFQVAHGAAVRMFMDLANDLNTNVGRHPQDYALYCIGQFNDATGCMLPNDVREHITDAVALLNRRNQPDFFTDGAGATAAVAK